MIGSIRPAIFLIMADEAKRYYMTLPRPSLKRLIRFIKNDDVYLLDRRLHYGNRQALSYIES